VSEGLRALVRHATGEPEGALVLLHGRGADEHDLGRRAELRARLGAGRPRPAAIVALSGFMPEVEGFELDLTGLDGYPVAIGHGALDPVISVEWSRAARAALEAAGADVTYRESPLPHTVDPGFLPELRSFVSCALR